MSDLDGGPAWTANGPAILNSVCQTPNCSASSPAASRASTQNMSLAPNTMPRQVRSANTGFAAAIRESSDDLGIATAAPARPSCGTPHVWRYGHVRIIFGVTDVKVQAGMWRLRPRDGSWAEIHPHPV